MADDAPLRVSIFPADARPTPGGDGGDAAQTFLSRREQDAVRRSPLYEPLRAQGLDASLALSGRPEFSRIERDIYTDAEGVPRMAVRGIVEDEFGTVVSMHSLRDEPIEGGQPPVQGKETVFSLSDLDSAQPINGRIPPDQRTGFMERIGRALNDVGRALGEGLQPQETSADVAQGVAEGVSQGMANVSNAIGLEDAVQWMNENVADLSYDLSEPETAAGQIVGAFAEFAPQMAVGGAAVSGLKASGLMLNWLKGTGAGAIADMLSNPDDPTLGDLAQELGEVDDPTLEAVRGAVAASLARDEDDSEFEIRLKQAGGGVAAGALFDSMIGLYRGMRAARQKAPEAFQKFVDRYGIYASAGGGPDAAARGPITQMGPDGNTPDRISTRQPGGEKATEDPIAEDLVIDLEAMRRNPKAFKNNMDVMRTYVNWPKSVKVRSPEKVAEWYKQHMVDNLLWLFDSVDPAIRNRSRHWYDGARAVTERWSERYQMPDRVIAGVLAALSPQKDWFQNASMGERVLDIMTQQQNFRWSDEMEQTASRIYRSEKQQLVLDAIRGKTLGELDDAFEKAAWVRAFDEAHNDRGYRTLTPEGDFIGEPRGFVQWSSGSIIAKAIRVIEDQSYESISANMGARHKVRNFYNNIIAPNSTHGDVTVDTHAVAAALLRPLAGNDREVGHNLLTLPGASSDITSGALGTYGLYADAYREAAEQRGVLPREMQSITWEAVRELYPKTFKNAKNKKMIDGIWQQFRDGEISADQAREQINEAAGGITEPEWARSAGRVDEQKRDTSYARELSGTGLPGGFARRLRR